MSCKAIDDMINEVVMNTGVKSIMNIMDSMHITSEQAMDAHEIPQEERDKYLSMIESQMKDRPVKTEMKVLGKESGSMSPTITLCMESPIKTSISDWLNTYIGRAAVGRKKDGYYEILAYSDRESDHSELYKMAKNNDARYIRSFLSEGVTTVE